MAAVTKVQAVARVAGVAVNDVVVVKDQQAHVNNTTAVTNTNNVGDLPATVNGLIAVLVAHGLMA